MSLAQTILRSWKSLLLGRPALVVDKGCTLRHRIGSERPAGQQITSAGGHDLEKILRIYEAIEQFDLMEHQLAPRKLKRIMPIGQR